MVKIADKVDAPFQLFGGYGVNNTTKRRIVTFVGQKLSRDYGTANHIALSQAYWRSRHCFRSRPCWNSSFQQWFLGRKRF